jgi:orotidine-5'-phosphate decarboxylase
MLTGGGLALANELKQDHGKRIFLDMKLFDIPATIENAVGVWRNTIWIS